MPRSFRSRIPDHDGAALPELRESFARIDAHPGILIFPGARRVFRAAAAYDQGGDMDLHRNLGFAVAEIAAELRMSDWEVRRLLMSPRGQAISDAIRLFRP